MAAGAAYAETLYSYTDENGIRMFTNVPPKQPVPDLQMSGPPPSYFSSQKASAKGFTAKSSRFDPIIDKYSVQYGLDPSLVRSVIATESGFNERAVSPKGARGLMQLMPGTAADLGVRNILDPEENIHGGVKHLRFLLDTFNNDLSLSLAAYNAGHNRVQRLGRVPNIPETRNYVESIKKRYGATQMAETSTAPPGPTTFRFTDENGVLHLTNIPPVQR
jgi:soluble lytic murein transglycosylase-like protein